MAIEFKVILKVLHFVRVLNYDKRFEVSRHSFTIGHIIGRPLHERFSSFVTLQAFVAIDFNLLITSLVIL
jgi:hypothetical protein